jgi:hypothetical protein
LTGLTFNVFEADAALSMQPCETEEVLEQKVGLSWRPFT